MDNVMIVFVVFLAIIFLTDLLTGLIYDKILLIMAATALIFDFNGQLIPIDGALIGAFFGGILMFVIQMLSRGGLGGGDVKFAFVLGLWLGLHGLLNALFMSLLSASIIGLAVYAIKRDLKTKIPFGPFMSIGAFLDFICKIDLIS